MGHYSLIESIDDQTLSYPRKWQHDPRNLNSGFMYCFHSSANVLAIHVLPCTFTTPSRSREVIHET